jgi:hypothetical protein
VKGVHASFFVVDELEFLLRGGMGVAVAVEVEVDDAILDSGDETNSTATNAMDMTLGGSPAERIRHRFMRETSQ